MLELRNTLGNNDKQLQDCCRKHLYTLQIFASLTERALRQWSFQEFFSRCSL